MSTKRCPWSVSGGKSNNLTDKNPDVFRFLVYIFACLEWRTHTELQPQLKAEIIINMNLLAEVIAPEES